MTHKLERRTRLAAGLVAGGLAVQGLSLLWSHPTAFLLSLGVGGLFLGVGILIFLSTLLVERT